MLSYYYKGIFITNNKISPVILFKKVSAHLSSKQIRVQSF